MEKRLFGYMSMDNIYPKSEMTQKITVLYIIDIKNLLMTGH